MYQIENLQELVKDYLGGDREFLSYTTKNLTAPGENYGSLMLSVEIIVKNKRTSQEETIYAVAKTPPPSEFSQKLFNTQVTFKNEIEFYRTVFPLLQNFQKEHGLEPFRYFADFIGARLNLKDEGDIVDSNAVLILENLVVKNFIVECRQTGFSLETSKLILRDLANLHATGLAFKVQKPKQFQNKIKPYLDAMIFGEALEGDEFFEDTMNDCVKALKEHQNLSHLEPIAVKLLNNVGKYKSTEPFATIVHADLWVNNTMLKYDRKTPVENKFIDFQVCRYQSPANDLLFFLFTSVEDSVLKENLDYLIQFYYDEFLLILKKLKCDTSRFSFDEFKKELAEASKGEFSHCLFMLYPILLDKSKGKDVKDFSADMEIEFEMTSKHKEKLYFIVETFDSRGWLD